MGLSLQISCTRMRYMQSYLLALPNIVWPRRFLSKHRKDNRCHIVFLLCWVGPTTTDHHRVFQLTKPSLRRFSNFLSYDVCSPSPLLFPLLASYDSCAAFLECGILVRDCTIAKSFITAQFSHSC